MSKELTPLEALERLYDYHNLPNRNVVAYLLEQENLPTYRKIIETALKELEVKREVIDYLLTGDDEKKLKTLEIIKEKSVDIGFLQYSSTVDLYNHYIVEHAWTKHTSSLTQEEYDLLKEVLL